jgi:flavin-binding protein dodecin
MEREREGASLGMRMRIGMEVVLFQPVILLGEEEVMSIARVTEISSSSGKSFEDAIAQGIARASKTVRGIKSAWVKEQEVKIQDNKIVEYRVFLKITFVLDDIV